MILNLIITLLVIVLLLVFYQDFKRRTIHVILPVLVFSLGLVVNYLSPNLNFVGMVYNMAFVAINMIGIVLYFSIKSKQLINPIDNVIGLGDVIFFIVITPLFSLKPFILFFIIGLLFSLITHLIYSAFKKSENIPLAGYLSIFLVVHLVVKNVFKVNMAL